MEKPTKNKVIALEDLQDFTFHIDDYSSFVVDELDPELRNYDFTEGIQTFNDVIKSIQKALNQDYPVSIPKKLTVKKEYSRIGKDETFTSSMSLTQMEAIDLENLISGFHPAHATFIFNIDLEKKIYIIKATAETNEWELFIEVKPAEDVPESLYGYTLDNNITKKLRGLLTEFTE